MATDLTNAWVSPARQQFLDANGEPLALGTVAFFEVGTSTPKDTFTTPFLTQANQNPLTLDAAGRADIWGGGFYRQVVLDVNGVEQWDRVTVAGGEIPAGGATGLFFPSIYMEDKPAAAEVYPIWNAPISCQLLAGLVDGFFTIGVNPTGSFLITLQKNAVTFGTITFSTLGVPTVSVVSDVLFGPGDPFSVDWPASQDATGANIALTFVFHPI
jgi:hypothetical protein